MAFNLGSLLRLPLIATPKVAPPAGTTQFYAKADGRLYRRGHDGVEHLASGAPVIVAAANPHLSEPGMWVQTLPNGDVSLWIEDGT